MGSLNFIHNKQYAVYGYGFTLCVRFAFSNANLDFSEKRSSGR